MIQAERDLRLPPAAQVRDPKVLEGVFDGPVQPAEVMVPPDRCAMDDRRQLLDHRARAAVPTETGVGPAGDDVGAIHDPARVLEAPPDAEYVELAAVGATGAVAEG